MPGLTPDQFVTLHPQLFHMAADGAWPQIHSRGLLSTTAILDLARVTGEEREALESRRRLDSVTVTTPVGQFVLRDQKPLSESKLASCLVDMSVSEWLRLLNSKVYLWPTRRRCEELLAARAYRDRKHTVIEFDTAALLARHQVTLSPINSGAVLYDPPARGSFTFTPIEEFPWEWYRKRGRTKAVAEVAVDYAIPNVEGLVTGVWRAGQGQWERIG